jgi:uncharacterized membrane protein YheB (UPF0754 family)
MNKSLATNLFAFALTLLGYYLPWHGDLIFDTGIFALSGAITNWLAIYMLFEKVPYCYGSGVIPSRFEEFKAGIKALIVQEFFTREHIERFFQRNGRTSAESISANINFDQVFEHLTDAITESSLGGMLNMMGGRQALEPLKGPITAKLQGVVTELVNQAGNASGESDMTAVLVKQVEHIIDNRLAELTPEKVKQIVEDMIRKHLGWLVVWGGVFGGLIGVVANLLEA